MPYQVYLCGYENTLLKTLPYKAFTDLGLDLWQPRLARYPTLDKHAAILPQHIRINAECLVIEITQEQKKHDAATAKILHGMLSVLELPSNKIMLGTIKVPCDTAAVIQQIQIWKPRNILQLDMQFLSLGLPNCISTYSPSFLLQNPKYKPEAYKALLNLRARIHGRAQHTSQNDTNRRITRT